MSKPKKSIFPKGYESPRFNPPKDQLIADRAREYEEGQRVIVRRGGGK